MGSCSWGGLSLPVLTLLLYFKAGATGRLVAVCSGTGFAEALVDPTVNLIVLAGDLAWRDSDWEGYRVPVPLLRNVTISGNGSADSPDTWPLLNVGNVSRKIRLGNGVTFTLRWLVLNNTARVYQINAPGLPLIAPCDPGDSAVLEMANITIIQRICYPAKTLLEMAKITLRPDSFSGGQLLRANLNQTGCVNETLLEGDGGGGADDGAAAVTEAAPSVEGGPCGSVVQQQQQLPRRRSVHPQLRCYAMKGAFDDVAVVSADMSSSQQQIPAGYIVRSVSSSFACLSVLDSQCIEQFGTLGCWQAFLKSLQLNGGGTSSTATTTSGAAGSYGGGGGGGEGGGGGAGHGAVRGEILGSVLGGIALVGLLAVAVAAAVRHKDRASHQLHSSEGPGHSPKPAPCYTPRPHLHPTPDPPDPNPHQPQERYGAGGNPFPGPPGAAGCEAVEPLAELPPFGRPPGVRSRLNPLPPRGCLQHNAYSMTDNSVASDSTAAAAAAAPTAAAELGPSAQSSSGTAVAARTGLAEAQAARDAVPDPYVVVSPLTPQRSDVVVGLEPSSEVRLLPRVLGRGTFGRVVEGEYRGQKVAVKLLPDCDWAMWGLVLAPSVTKVVAATATVTAATATVTTAVAATECSVGGSGCDCVTLVDDDLGRRAGGEGGGRDRVYGGKDGCTAAAVAPPPLLPHAAEAEVHPGNIHSLAQEVEVLGRCCHPNVVLLLAACLTPPRVCLVMELMDISLDRLLYSQRCQLLPMRMVLDIAMDVACGLQYLHPTIVHRDLKPGNVLVNWQPSPKSPRVIAKLTDFGLARLRLGTLATHNPEAGTPEYMAPELFDVQNDTVRHQADIYSFGVLLWEMLAGRRPWEGEKIMVVAYRVTMLHQRLSLSVIPPGRRPVQLLRLIEQCWDTEPLRRPAAGEIVKELSMMLQLHLTDLGAEDGLDAASAVAAAAAAGATTSGAEAGHEQPVAVVWV